MAYFGFYSYSIGLITFTLVLLLAFARLKKNSLVPEFTLAVATSVAWMASVVFVFKSDTLYLSDTFALESLRNATWFYFLTVLISQQVFLDKYALLKQSKVVMILFTWVAIVLTAELSPTVLGFINVFLGQDLRLLAHVSFAIVGLMLMEQLYRSVDNKQRWAIKYLCLSLAAIFAFDFITYSKSLLFGQIDFMLWNSRGLISALCAPLLAISFSRLQDNQEQVTVSRTIVVHTTVLFGSGLYMILMSLAGYYIKNFGGSWGVIVQTFFIFLAIILLLTLFASDTIRAYIKVYFNKHFFQHQYDYREEWIKLSREIATLHSLEGLSQFIIKTLADFVGSLGGGLWSTNDQGAFYLAENRSLGFDSALVFNADDEFIHFLNKTQWVIDFCEFKNNPEMYDKVDLSPWLTYKNIWLIIPLLQQNKIVAFVVLTKPLVMRQLNYEDHDLLRTVGMQLANALALSKVTDDLSRARQFEAYSRFSAFLVHDIKNLVAQVSMIVKNAETHKRNPEFIDDAIDTLENVVNKMERLLAQLKKGEVKAISISAVNLVSIISDAVLQQAGQLPKVNIDCPLNECLVYADKGRLIAILGHLIQNAQDATQDDGNITLSLSCVDSFALIEISDTGCGMSHTFTSERLFKPFDTTKGNAGMGIGVYEAREYIVSQGGKISVTSELGVGTIFSIRYPLVKGLSR
jgi:putative PEP-CTERM system histidine kinase